MQLQQENLKAEGGERLWAKAPPHKKMLLKSDCPVFIAYSNHGDEIMLKNENSNQKYDVARIRNKLSKKKENSPILVSNSYTIPVFMPSGKKLYYLNIF